MKFLGLMELQSPLPSSKKPVRGHPYPVKLNSPLHTIFIYNQFSLSSYFVDVLDLQTVSYLEFADGVLVDVTSPMPDLILLSSLDEFHEVDALWGSHVCDRKELWNGGSQRTLDVL